MLLIPTTACSNFREKLEAFLLDAVENGLVADGALAQDINQASSFWHIREVQVYNIIFSNSVPKVYSLKKEKMKSFLVGLACKLAEQGF